MNDQSYTSMPVQFIKGFPILAAQYEQLLVEWEGEIPEPTIVFDDIVSPYLIQLLRAPENNGDQLMAMFAFFEMMAVHENQHVRDLLSVTVCEHIVNAGLAIYDNACPFMESFTRQMVDDVAPHFGVVVSNPC